MTRDERIRSLIDKSKLGLEIGPSFAPVCPKSAGYWVETIDHLDQENLRQKYASHGIDIRAIEAVDYVWRGESYRALTGKSHEYGWIIASHVIEHTPDFIRFLQGCDDVLDETGQLSLAIPDKRYTFDHLRENSSLSAIIEAYEQKRTTHSPGSVADYFSNVSHPRRGARFLPRRMRLKSSAFIHSHDETMAAIQTARNGGFLDIHAWCFTPSSFRLLIEDLYRLGYIKLRESAYLGASRNEFFIALSRSGAGAGMTRLQLALKSQRET
jgi:hypothetical protein